MSISRRVTVGRLLGWRLGLDHVDPKGTVALTSAGGDYTVYPRGATPTLPTIFAHRDVGNTDCPGNAAYAVMGRLRDIAARFNKPFGPEDLAESLRGGAIFGRWDAMGGMNSPLGAPTSPEASGVIQSSSRARIDFSNVVSLLFRRACECTCGARDYLGVVTPIGACGVGTVQP